MLSGLFALRFRLSRDVQRGSARARTVLPERPVWRLGAEGSVLRAQRSVEVLGTTSKGPSSLGS